MADMSEQRTDPVLRRRIDQALVDAATDAARRTARVAAGGYFVLVLFLLAGAIAYQRNTNERLDRSEMFACERVQLQRERTNVSEARQFLLMTAIAEAPRASEPVRDEYAGLARTARYDPPTDCRAAVRHPGSYRRPPSVLFVDARDGERGEFPGRFARAVVRAAQEGRPQPVPRG